MKKLFLLATIVLLSLNPLTVTAQTPRSRTARTQVPGLAPRKIRKRVKPKAIAAKPSVSKPATRKPATKSRTVRKGAPQKVKAVAKPAAKKKPAVKAVSKAAPKKPTPKKPAPKKAALKSAPLKKPAAKKPVAAKPTVAKPAVKKPAGAKPAAPKPPVAKQVAPKPVTAPLPVAPPKPALPLVPPTAQAYAAIPSGVQRAAGQTLVPATWLADALGASVGPVQVAPGQNVWRVSYFGKTADFTPNQTAAVFNEEPVTLATPPVQVKDILYVPWDQLAEFLGVKWKLLEKESRDVMLLQYPAAVIRSVRHSNTGDKVRVVLELSNPTRIIAAQNGLDVQFYLAGAREPAVPTVMPIQDYLVPRAVVRSGNWQANVAVRLNYSAPVRWFTLGNPSRLVIDLQRLFEESNVAALGGGLSLDKIRRGTGHGPVQMFLVRFDPAEGWRLRVEPGGYSTLQRNRTSVIAKRAKSLVAVNGGFFAYDGAAVGAVLRNGEWIRLPWRGRTALGIGPDGNGHIDNLQTKAVVKFSSGLEIPIRDLNGWPDRNSVTAITRRFRPFVKLKAGQIALVVQNGVVTAKPGSGNVAVPTNGFILVASGGATPWLNRAARGERAALSIQPIGWPSITTALGGGPRLVNGGQIEMTAVREGFRDDVRVGLGPRTAVGIDADGRFMILVVDGRQKFYSTGLTLTELAYTMQKFGAVDAINYDGGGSTTMAVRGKVINRPSDHFERAVSNALVVTR